MTDEQYLNAHGNDFDECPEYMIEDEFSIKDEDTLEDSLYAEKAHQTMLDEYNRDKGIKTTPYVPSN